MVAAQLRRRIITGELGEGDALPPEAELMAQLGVSRPTLREAFRVLEAEGVITIRRGARGGARVLLPDIVPAARAAGTLLQYRGVTLGDVYDARAQLELTAVATLTRKRSAQSLRKLDQAIEATDEGSADHDARSAEAAFHHLLVEIAGNSSTVMLHELLTAIMRSHGETFDESLQERTVSPPVGFRGVHRELVNLIRRRDVEAAVQLWQKHLSETMGLIDGNEDEALEILS